MGGIVGATCAGSRRGVLRVPGAGPIPLPSRRYLAAGQQHQRVDAEEPRRPEGRVAVRRGTLAGVPGRRCWCNQPVGAAEAGWHLASSLLAIDVQAAAAGATADTTAGLPARSGGLPGARTTALRVVGRKRPCAAGRGAATATGGST